MRDGFHFWAFVLAPVWLLVRQLWLAFFIYVVADDRRRCRARSLPARRLTCRRTATIVIALLIGFEASTIRRWTLTRRRWKNLGFVVAEDREIAERRFFARVDRKRAGSSDTCGG